MTYYIVKLNTYYNSEFPVTGFSIFNEDFIKEFKNTIRKLKEEIEIYFGINQSIYFENGEAILDSMHFRKISEEDANKLTKYLSREYGLLTPYAIYVEVDEFLKDIEE